MSVCVNMGMDTTGGGKNANTGSESTFVMWAIWTAIPKASSSACWKAGHGRRCLGARGQLAAKILEGNIWIHSKGAAVD